MKRIQSKPILLSLIIFCFLAVSGIVILIIGTKPMPVALLQEYGIGLLWEEGQAMNECAECHKAVDFHSCKTCHDDHGSAEISGIKFFEVIELTGDVPDPAFVRVNEVMPNQEEVGTHILLFDFLKRYGVTEFESVSFITNDGGLATIKSQYLDETVMLVPYMDGVRFVTESVHVSTWLKGIKRIIVVGTEKPLIIDGQETSVGQLLLGETVRITVEGSDVMLISEEGETKSAFVANTVEGAKLLPLLETENPSTVLVTLKNGETTELNRDDFENAVIAVVRGQVTLVLPDRGRGVWLSNIQKIDSSK
jgi:hypothetical protein